MEKNCIFFKTSDGVEFQAPLEILKMLSSLNSLTDLNAPVQLEIKAQEFSLVLQFCDHHKYTNPPEIIRPLKSNELKKCVADEWDAEFVNLISFEKVTDLLLGAEYLKCFSLVDLCYAKLALFFRVTPVSELKRIFQLSDTEFTEQELEEIKVNNVWLMKMAEDRVKELENC